MPFDSGKFEAAEFEARERVLAVPALSEFFGDDPPEWTVRGLDSNELNQAFEAERSRKEVSKIVDAISDAGVQADQIRAAIGLGKGTPAEVAKRLQMLVSGSVNPQVSMPIAAKLAENFPIEFLLLTNAVSELTGLGAEIKKPAAASPQIAA